MIVILTNIDNHFGHVLSTSIYVYIRSLHGNIHVHTKCIQQGSYAVIKAIKVITNDN